VTFVTSGFPKAEYHLQKCQGKATRKMQPRLLVRLVITLFAAWPLAVIVSGDSAALVWVWILSWAGLYWLWKLWDHRRGNAVAKGAVGPRAVAAPVSKPQVLPSHAARPLWRRTLWRTLKLAGGAIAVIVLMIGSMIVYLGYCERQAKAERNKVQIGMTVDDVLLLVHGACVRAHAVLPDNVPDPEGVHYATLVEHPDGTYSNGVARLSDDVAITLMKQKMEDGYEWALAIHLHQCHTPTFLIHRDLRARRTSEGSFRCLGLGLADIEVGLGLD
jgi:hypothetical protein